jgi:hypothetical protein
VAVVYYAVKAVGRKREAWRLGYRRDVRRFGFVEDESLSFCRLWGRETSVRRVSCNRDMMRLVGVGSKK